jgi:hypothetical protein
LCVHESLALFGAGCGDKWIIGLSYKHRGPFRAIRDVLNFGQPLAVCLLTDVLGIGQKVSNGPDPDMAFTQLTRQREREALVGP